MGDSKLSLGGLELGDDNETLKLTSKDEKEFDVIKQHAFISQLVKTSLDTGMYMGMSEITSIIYPDLKYPLARVGPFFSYSPIFMIVVCQFDDGLYMWVCTMKDFGSG